MPKLTNGISPRYYGLTKNHHYHYPVLRNSPAKPYKPTVGDLAHKALVCGSIGVVAAGVSSFLLSPLMAIAFGAGVMLVAVELLVLG